MVNDHWSSFKVALANHLNVNESTANLQDFAGLFWTGWINWLSTDFVAIVIADGIAIAV